MTFLRKYPFSDEDPLDIMLQKLHEQARRDGTPLTADEERLLRLEWNDRLSVAAETEERFRKLVVGVLETESADPEVSSNWKKRGFGNAIEWAGTGAYPYIVYLAEHVLEESPELQPPLTPKEVLKDKAQLIGYALAVVSLMFVLFGVITLVGGK